MDKYPVTYRRYAECVAAGGCTQLDPLPPEAATIPEAMVWEATWDQSVAFCAWDGGRLLTTAAQWEKAASGPSPLDLDYIWTVQSDCTLLPRNPACPGVPVFTTQRIFDRYDAFPASASYYGVQMMGMSYFEHMRDVYLPGYPPQTSTMVVDPVNTTPSVPYGGHYLKGAGRQGTAVLLEIFQRSSSAVPPNLAAFRCVRAGQ